MLPHAGSFELRLADLEAHLERLNSTLHQWGKTGEPPHPVEQHLSLLAERCSDIVRQWAATSERHAQAVGELEAKLNDWNDIATRLQRDATWRFQDLERLIEHEWASLRRLHEEPVRQLRDQAESLTEICVSTAGSTQTGIERAEARLAGLERDLHRRMDDLSRDVHAVLSELRQQNTTPPRRSPSSSWALDEVTRLHHEIRDGSNTVQAHVHDESVGDEDLPTSALALLTSSGFTEPDDDPSEESHEHSTEPSGASQHRLTNEAEPVDRHERSRFGTIAAIVLIVAIAAAFSVMFYNRATLAADQAAAARQHADEIAAAANERIEAARRDSAAQIELARDAASRAQITSDVLAAPDLVRFNLTGADGSARASAQLLFSRSRGMVFSGSRLLSPGSGNVYQIWLLTATDPVSGGTITPDDSGRATLATDRAPDVPRPIVSVRVTVEPAPGRTTPSDQTVLFRAQ
jgi:cell division protein FtsB